MPDDETKGTLGNAGTLEAGAQPLTSNHAQSNPTSLSEPQIKGVPAVSGTGDDAKLLKDVPERHPGADQAQADLEAENERAAAEAADDPFPKPVRTLIVQTHAASAIQSLGIHVGLTAPQAGDLPPLWDPKFSGNTAVVRPAVSVATERQAEMMANEVKADAKALFDKVRIYFGDEGHEYGGLMRGLFAHVHPAMLASHAEVFDPGLVPPLTEDEQKEADERAAVAKAPVTAAETKTPIKTGDNEKTS